MAEEPADTSIYSGGGEVLPPEPTINVPRPSKPTSKWKTALILAGSVLGGVAENAFSNYLQTRGFVSVEIARIFLGVCWVATSALIFIAVMAFDIRRRWLTIGCGVGFLTITLVGLEAFASRAKVSSDTKTTPPAIPTVAPAPTRKSAPPASPKAISPCPNPLNFTQIPLGIGPPYIREVTVSTDGAKGFRLFTNAPLLGDLPEVLTPGVNGSWGGNPEQGAEFNFTEGYGFIRVRLTSTSKVSTVCIDRIISPKDTQPPELARILITKMEIILAGSLPKNAAPWSAVNVYFANFSEVPADEEASASTVLPIAGTITAEQAEEQVRTEQDKLLTAFKWDELMSTNKGREINKEDPQTFFTIPSAPTGDQAQRVGAYFNSNEPNKKLYILVAIKYRTHSMDTHTRSVTEGCGYFLGDDSPMHRCGRNRIFFEHF